MKWKKRFQLVWTYTQNYFLVRLTVLVLWVLNFFFRENRFGIWIYNMKHINLRKYELKKKKATRQNNKPKIKPKQQTPHYYFHIFFNWMFLDFFLYKSPLNEIIIPYPYLVKSDFYCFLWLAINQKEFYS